MSRLPENVDTFAASASKGRRLTRRRVAAGVGGVLLAGGVLRRAGAAQAPVTPATRGATRTVAHGLGTTEVPAEPRRVVALGSAVDVALTVGVTPVGIDDRSAQKAYLADRLAGVPTVGLGWEPNLERLAALDPDLILGLDIVIEEVYDRLSDIAPTVGVAFGEASGEWKRYNGGFAEALGRAAAFEQAMAAYEAKAERFKAAMGDRLAETRVAILRATPDNLRFDLPGIFVGSVVYGDAGLALPPGLADHLAADPAAATLDVSPEQFTLAEGADAVFVWSVSGDPAADRRAIEDILADPLLGRLEAARQGRVYAVGDHWFSESVLGAGMVLDDLERYLLAGAAAPRADR